MEYLKPHHENQDQGKQSITPESWPPIKYPYHLITEKGIREGEKKHKHKHQTPNLSMVKEV